MQQTVVLNTLFALFASNPDAFNALPEFAFVVPLAERLKRKGCSCGEGQNIADATAKFNEVVQALPEESIARIKAILNVGPGKLLFGIQTGTDFHVKEY